MLAEMTGAVAVVLGGSRAVRSEDEGSDWDLGVYYRGEIDLTALILRDLNVVEYWTRRAEEGEFDRDALLGYIAGVPTYLLTAELASCRVLRGELPTAPPFPTKLAAAELALLPVLQSRIRACAREPIPAERELLVEWVDRVANLTERGEVD